jgi:hypothetical protein
MLRAGLSGSLLLLAVVSVHGAARAADSAALPEHLRDTGLYADDVLPFSPQYPCGGRRKRRRWIHVRKTQHRRHAA